MSTDERWYERSPAGPPADPAHVPVDPTDSALDMFTGELPRLTADRSPRRSGRRRSPRGERRADPISAQSQLAGLDARNISAWFGNHQVLDRVSLEMSAGNVTALIGPSGCGKSTFLRVLNRMHEMIPSAAMAGEVMLDGHDIYDPARKLTDARREIGMVFQKPNPFPAMSIYDNVLASSSSHASPKRGCGTRSATASVSPAVACRAASSNVCASPEPWPSGRESS
jgi:ABC-type multidrug transport system fused ATPase/permease subunit